VTGGHRTTAQRLTTVALAAVVLGLVLAWLVVITLVRAHLGYLAIDANTYLAAGERLNAGHPLYTLSPGDRSVLLGTTWQTPLVSPPLIAVLWRPLAALPNPIGEGIWGLICIAALLIALIQLGRRQPTLVLLAMLPLGSAIVEQITVANVNSVLLLGLIYVWRSTAVGQEARAGMTAALMAVVKATPAVVIWWMLVTGKRRAFSTALLGVALLLVIGLIGAGIQANLDYVAMLRSPTAIGVYDQSLGGIVLGWGAPIETARFAPYGAAAVGLAVIWLLRHDLAASFAVAIVTLVYGSPALTDTWYVLLLAAIAPLAYPVGSGTGQDPVEDVVWLLGRKVVSGTLRGRLTSHDGIERGGRRADQAPSEGEPSGSS
jgi:hypothetical protein